MIELYQGSWYQLIFPITSNGADVATITDAKLDLYQGPTAALTLILNTELSFSDSKVIATLDETSTVNLLGNYQYELWIVDFQNNPIFVRKGEIKFVPTKTRF